MTVTRTDVAFGSRGLKCRAWRYAPSDASAGTEPRPCVVMAHGFAAPRDASLEPYAERFAAAGMHVLLFDYRHFGESEGEPRQLLSVRRQLQDYAAAVHFAGALSGVDPKRIAVWGTSFAGGHALVTAARMPEVAAAVCQCPMLDGLAAVANIAQYAGIDQLLRLSLHGLLDVLRMPFGGAHYIPAVGPPGTLAVMTSADADAGYRALLPEGARYDVAARIALTAGLYRPLRHAGKVRCPVLLQVCEHDSVAPPACAEQVLRSLGTAGEAKRYGIGHFDVYRGPSFEQCVADQLEFLQRHLRPRPELTSP